MASIVIVGNGSSNVPSTSSTTLTLSESEESPSLSAASLDPAPFEDGQYEVEKIVNYVMNEEEGGSYFIKWKNWDVSTNTWEPQEHLQDSQEELIRFYLERRKEVNDNNVKSVGKYTQTDSGKKRKKNTSSGLDLPPDPRPLTLIASEFYKIHKPPSEAETEDFRTVWCSNKLIEQSSLEASKKTTWDILKIEKTIARCLQGNFGDSKIRKLQAQILFYDFERKHVATTSALKKWEKKIYEISLGNPKIKIENVVDFEGPPDNFTYINDYLPFGVTIPDDPVVGCDCSNTGSCYENRGSCCAVDANSTYAYSEAGKLKVPLRTPIYECNSKCSCGPKCPNRVVQNGPVNLSLAIYRTSSGMGWGVKTLKNIKRGTFVGLYVGEIINAEEAERRCQEYSTESRTYLFDLDFNEQGDNCPFTVDAARFGNITHFVNHSCDPNLAVFPVWINCLDPDLPMLALFTIKEVQHGAELFFDYQMGLKNKDNDTSTTTNSDEENEKEPCLCGSRKCRKFLC